MNSSRQDEPIEQGVGRLEVELPHWTAKITVYDNLYSPLPRDSFSVQHFSSTVDGVEATLAPGVYNVVVSLGEQSESQLVVIRPDHTTHIEQAQWKKMTLNAAIPLENVEDTSQSQIEHAEKLSHTLTWIDSPGGDSRLFLFIRTAQPKQNPAFADGLRLLTVQGKEITDFTSGIKQNKRSGWLAFNADLPAGYYILRYSRRGARTRHQPIYLCTGWETQVFLLSEQNHPSLATLSMNMAERGTGFHSDSEATIAAESVMDDMRRGNRAGIVTRDKIGALLGGKQTNPWLGILAGYALLRFRAAKDSRYESLIPQVLDSLTRISDHPDACAIRLECTGETQEPFTVPPLLHDGLQIVRKYDVYQADTIPLQSLTDLILPKLLVDSPWVAWQQLDEKPQLTSPAAEPGAEAAFELVADATSRSSKSQSQPVTRAAFTPSANSYTQAFVQAASPRLPVYRLPTSSEEAEEQNKATKTVGSYAAPATVATVLSAPLLQAVQDLTLNNDPEALPDRIAINSAQLLNEMLAQVSAVEISEKHGIPLSRAEQGLAGLRQVSATESAQATTKKIANEMLTADEKAVFEYVVQQSSQKRQTVTRAATIESSASTPVTDQGSQAPSSPSMFSIEGCVAQIQDAADSLLVPSSQNESNAEIDSLALRLRQIADTLLSRADFIIVTGTDGQVYYANGAFLSLITPTAEATITPSKTKSIEAKKIEAWRREASEQSLKNQRVWEGALVTRPPGKSTLADPLAASSPVSAGKQWTLRRTIIVDDATQSEVAYLNTLHYADTPGLTLKILDLFKKRISSLTLYTSMYAYGTGGDTGQQKTLAELEALVTEFEQALGETV